MTDAILNNKRRLERHTRRDGQLQARARPASVERSEDDASSVAYIRNFVEESHMAGSKRQGFPLLGGGDASTSTGGSGERSTTAGSGNQSTSRGNGNSGGRSTTAAQTTRSIVRASTQAAETTVASPTTTAQQVIATETSTSAEATSTRASRTRTSATATSADLTSTSAQLPTTTSLGLSTAVAFVTASASSTANIAASSSTATSKPDSNGVGVGPIIGIVAGSLAGVAIIAVIVGYLFKKFGRKEDPYEGDPFNPDDFRRQSAMLPDAFESDDGHASMSEYRNNMSPFGNEAGYGAAAGAGIGGAAAGGMVAANSFTSHNESGGPRPPTMFQKHINGQASRYNNNENMPQIGALYNPNDISPSLPVMAFGGSDPYSIAGVGRNHHMDPNISNPYAHLDRSPSALVQRTASQAQQNGGQEAYAGPDRSNGSNGSSYRQFSHEQYQSGAHEYDANHDTAGRPGTAEGRSGTPDLPNVQQTYAGTGIDERQEMDRVASPHHMMASPEQPHEYYNQGSYQDENAALQQPLQVRNLLPNSHQMQQQRASAVSNDEDAAYGGVW